jgi:paraquat-inducible protein B
MSEPIVEKKRGISPVWILPILAVCLGGWLLFKSARDAGIDITLHVNDSNGITIDKTPVMFKGNEVGIVKNIQVSPDLEGVDLIIEMGKKTEPYLVEDMKFWVEKVNVQAGRISGLETLLAGVHIGMRLGTSTKPWRSFVALPSRPPVTKSAPGLHLSLKADDLRSLEIGSGIYTSGIQIGSVQEYELKDDGVVLIDIYIEPQYKNFVRNGTGFWNASGITASGGITDLKIRVGSIASMIKGGIMMQTQDAHKNSHQAKNGQVFTLYKDQEEMETLNVIPEIAPGLRLSLKTDDLNSLEIGSGVYTNGILVGSVQKYELQDDDTVLIGIYIEPKYKKFVRKGTRFWNASGISTSGGIRDLKIQVASLSSMIKGGIMMQTPDALKNNPQAENGQVFTLYKDLEEMAALDAPTGLNVILETDNLGSLKIGSHVYYRRVTVGEITKLKFSPTFQKVLVSVTIYQQYVPVIRENTKFWNASGINVTGGVLSGLSVSTESVEALMKGGIALATPEEDEMGDRVSDGHRFVLYDEEEEEEWRKWSPEIKSGEGQTETDQDNK